MNDRPDQRRIGDIPVEVTSGDAAVARIVDAVAARAGGIFAFYNQHGFNLARQRSDFAAALRAATVFNDGIAIDVASRILHGAPFPANLNGTDLTPRVLAAVPAGTRVFLLGSAPGVADVAAEVLATRFPGIVIAGTRDGFFDATSGAAVADAIAATAPDLVLVGMGNPRQELWAAAHGARTGAVLMCIGAFLDFSAGVVSRAPEWVQRLRCEWAYRLVLEPRRMAGRYIGGAVPFLSAVLRERFSR